MEIIEKLKIRISNCYKDIQKFGCYIGITNMFWPIINSMPNFIASPLLKIKHELIINFITQKYGYLINKYNHLNHESNDRISTQLTIWVCWLQGEDNMPDIPKKCLSLIRRYSNGHPVILITSENIDDYISIPNYIQEKYSERKISNAHFADVIRTSLLAEKGGCWIDATILMTDQISDDVFKYPFYSIKFSKSGYYITENKWSNFFLACHRNSILFSFVRDLFYEYLKSEDRFIDYFLMDYFIRFGYENISEIKNMIDNVPQNNVDTHKLAPILLAPFDENVLLNMKKSTYLFKLSWRINPNNGIINNWSKLIS